MSIAGVKPLTVDQLVTLSAKELRALKLPDLLRLMTQLGLSVDGIESRTAALTRLIQNAFEVGD